MLAPYLFILAADVLGHMLDDTKYKVEGCKVLPVATLALARDQGKGVARLRAYK